MLSPLQSIDPELGSKCHKIMPSDNTTFWL